MKAVVTEATRKMVSAALLFGAGCSDSVDSPKPLTAIERFGQYHAEAYVEQTYPTTTPDGPFTTLQTSKAGFRAGRVAGRLAMWDPGSPAPVYLFRPDTSEDDFVVRGVNDRGEVLLDTKRYTAVYVWRSGVYKTVVKMQVFHVGRAINNRGTFVVQSQASGMSLYAVAASPFVADTTTTVRFSGSTCVRQGREQEFLALNDSNEVLAHEERTPNGGFGHMWIAGGCKDQDKDVFPAEWTVLGGDGLVGGLYRPGNDPTALITDGVGYAILDLLLDDASRALWHISSVVGISDDHSIIVDARSLSTGTTTRLRLTH